MINLKVDEKNGKVMRIENGGYKKVRQFSSSEFWKNICGLVSDPTFGLGGSRLWEKEEEIKISGKKSKRRSISINVDLYDFCLSYIVYCLLFYFMTTLTTFYFLYLWYLSH